MQRLRPAVPRRGLMLVAGIVWSGVGLMLGTWAVVWLVGAHSPGLAVALGAVGATLALVAWRLLFDRLADKNLRRLGGLPERVCLFAFQEPKGYLIMGSMIALGIALRHSALPKPDLAVVYAAIGGALFLASTRYYAHLLREPKGASS